MANIQKITPFLWFDGRVKEAAEYYTSIFEDSGVISATKLQVGPGAGASIISFELAGQAFTAQDGGPMFQFSPAISFVVNCETQGQVDRFWDRLSEDGEQDMCGWVRDKFGVSWQIVPAVLPDLLSDASKAGRVMEVFLQMHKIDISQLQYACDRA